MTTPAQRRAQEMADMAELADQQHHDNGTSPWAGTDNGAELPSADWAPDTSALRDAADRHMAIAAQYEPEPCTICRPRPHELCCCAGISTPRRRT